MDYYSVLGVSAQASTEEITKHFKRLALKYHPDKTNHDPLLTEKFKELNRAYEVLKDNRLRQIYDTKGEEGVRQEEAPPPNHHFTQGALAFSAFTQGSAQNIFTQIFSDLNLIFEQSQIPTYDFGDMKRHVEPLVLDMPRQYEQGKDIHHTCQVELGDLFYGKQIKLSLPKRLKCASCDGLGGVSPKTCRGCQGLGKVIISHFNEFSQMKQVGLCRACHGRGFYNPPAQACDDCKGAGYIKENKVLKVNLLPGSRNGDKIYLRGEGDEGPFLIPGDVIIHICERPHKFLVRRNNDLFMEKEIDLSTALLGGSIYIDDFVVDGQALHIDIEREQCPLQSGEPKLIKGYGMPINQATKGGQIEQTLEDVDFFKDVAFDMSKYPRGNLYINFTVKMPDLNLISETDATVLSLLLGSRIQTPDHGQIIGTGALTNLDNHKRRRL